MIKLIIGLNNPGNKYINTRHNIGSKFVYNLAKKYNKYLKLNKKICAYTGILNLKKKFIY